MSKQIRTLLISVVAVLVLVGLLLGLLFLLPAKSGSDSSADSSDTSITILDKSVDSTGATVSNPVSKVNVKLQSEQFAVSPNANGQMQVEDYSDLLINTTNIQNLTSNLAKLSATRLIADSVGNPADYGFDKPLAELDATYYDDSTVTVTVGNESPLKDGYYVQVSGNNAVYLLGTDVGEELTLSSVKYIGTTTITAPSVKSGSTGDEAVLQEMKLSGTVRASKPFSFRIHYDSDPITLSAEKYIMTSPVVTGFEDTDSSIITGATSLIIDGVEKAHPTADDLASYGLADPYSICEMTLAVQSTSTGTTGASSGSTPTTTFYNGQSHTIKLGNKNADGSYYALVDNYNVVYIIAPSSVPWATSQFNDLASKVLFVNNIADVSSITVTNAGKETTFTLTQHPNETDRDKNLTVTVGGTTYPTADFRTLYSVFMSVNRYGDTDQKPTGDPAVTFTIHTTDSSVQPFVARFYQLDASLYLCSVEGGDTYTVKTSDITKMLTQMNNYLNGQPVSYQ